MASTTIRLGLYMRDPNADANTNFNIKTMMNDNWILIDNLVALKADVLTPVEVQQKIDTAIGQLISGAPGALDTLNELADALGDDPNFAATVTNALATKETPAGAQAKVNTHAGDTTKHITAAERTTWNAKETPAGAQLKIDHASYKVARSSKDAEGIFTTVEYRRKSDNTLAVRSVLSGGTSPQYTTRTITFYASNGTTVARTDTFTISYDADGEWVGEA